MDASQYSQECRTHIRPEADTLTANWTDLWSPQAALCSHPGHNRMRGHRKYLQHHSPCSGPRRDPGEPAYVIVRKNHKKWERRVCSIGRRCQQQVYADVRNNHQERERLACSIERRDR